MTVCTCSSCPAVARGFVDRAAYRNMLALKREQESRLADFLLSIPSHSDRLFNIQLALCEADLENPPPSAPPLHLLPAPPPPSAPPLSVLTQQQEQLRAPLRQSSLGLSLPPVPPPPDLSRPPAEPLFENLVRGSGRAWWVCVLITNFLFAICMLHWPIAAGNRIGISQHSTYVLGLAGKTAPKAG